MNDAGHSRRNSIVVSALGIIFFVSRMCCLADDAQLLDVVTKGCSECVHAIQSGKGKMTVHVLQHTTGGGVIETSADCDVAYSGTRYAVSSQCKYLRNEQGTGEAKDPLLIAPGTILREMLSYDGHQIVLYRPDNRNAVTGDTHSPSAARARHNALAKLRSAEGQGMYVIDSPVPPENPENLTDGGLRLIGREPVDGNECIIVERDLTFPSPSGDTAKRTFVYWVDPARGFCVPKAQRWIEGGNYKTRALLGEATAEIREYGRQIFGPSSWRFVQYRPNADGAMTVDSQTDITYASDFKLNGEVSEADLKMDLPSGTSVYVEELDASYQLP